ncbi:MAG: LemA family protein [Planctomycetota bacterium]
MDLLGLWILLGVALLALLWWIAIHNRFVRLKAHVRESWAGIDVELKRRYELIPNLVATVKGYAAHERAVLERLVELRDRAAANHGTAESQARDENALLHGMRQLFVVAEGYPRLKSDGNFRVLQAELANTEDRIAAARRFYNGNVRELRTLRESFPTSLVASAAGVGDVSFFELEDANERVVPRTAMSAGD